MKTSFPKKECHVPKWFILDATNKTLGRLSTEVSKLLRGKEISYFTPGVDLGNFVIIINANKINLTGKKEIKKLYYQNSQRPGNLKIETLKDLRKRIPSRIIEKAVWGMLPKGVLGRQYYRRLYVYDENQILHLNKKNIEFNLNNSTKSLQVKSEENLKIQSFINSVNLSKLKLNEQSNLPFCENWIEIKT